MTDLDDSGITMGELGRRMTRLEDGQHNMLSKVEAGQQAVSNKVDAVLAGFVPRGEFDAWRTGLDREIRDIKASRVPWYTAAAMVISIAAIVIPMITKI